MARVVAVIPARMGSSRFPGKPLARILGRPMIEHVTRRTELSRRVSAVYVATCDDEIRVAVERFGGVALLTSSAHERATDRVAEAAGHLDADLVVMVQGDEPMITPEMIDASLAPFDEDPDVRCVNLVRRITRRDEFLDPNTIKVVGNVSGDAMYFSRAPIPAGDDAGIGTTPVFKQVCVIPFRREALGEFASLAPTPFERAESIDMLRVLEHGGRVRLVETDVDTHAVDTPDDLRAVESRMLGDPLIARYRGPKAPAGATR